MFLIDITPKKRAGIRSSARDNRHPWRHRRSQTLFHGTAMPESGNGGYAFHGPFEHITTEGMDAVVENLKGIVKAFGEKAV